MIDISAAIIAGLVATIVFDIWALFARATGITSMKVEKALGSMFTDGRGMTPIGVIIHFTFGAGIALLYAVIFEHASINNGTITGGVIGIFHGIIIGVIVMPMMGLLHPAMRKGKVEGPGFFAINKGSASPIYIIIGHIIFGLVIGTVYFMV